MEDGEADIHNFSTSPSQHRLPTVSAIEALTKISSKSQGIPCSLPALDTVLANEINGLSTTTPGIQRGHVTEVYGPPGVGKTTFGLQVSVNALHSSSSDSEVLWVDTGSPFIEERLDELLRSYTISADSDLPSSPSEPSDAEFLLQDKFTYLRAHTLPRLLTVFLHPLRSFPSSKTGLIVVDDLSNLLLGSFSRNPKSLQLSAPAAVREKSEKQTVSKRFQIIENLAAAMSRMAALKNIAILVLTNTTTSLKGQTKATLKAALASQAWDSAIHTRIMLYRGFTDDKQLDAISGTQSPRLRYAEVQRMAWKDVCMHPVPFVILSKGLRNLNLATSPRKTQADAEGDGSAGTFIAGRKHDLPFHPLEFTQSSQKDQLPQSKKRKALEIADSEDENEESGAEIQSDFDEPELPRMNSEPRQKIEEMILETHETALLRRDRYARIRGSEDEIPAASSELGEEAAVACLPGEGTP
ncbi:uncharacterized protein Z519_12474 [Cladophialophora bantiana CBS 173.52]|uniref:RecA family profile 1 domain-containing protein n=1 Tax=Cladophialophora bantiana (strain ATCC 10958 / CBS 173.52 / CDC B-1940 / NIH 8579) TaxID=1442370 RepID=A0A0D2H0P6_CLAB1|nr:uncharacterized protein Z519_12474 [Cladophialophora bantiana CBS 173.52]KIW86853.1 hypothetical protein Z519_12474 [Cladophialophora bantiana CBS 173.52]